MAVLHSVSLEGPFSIEVGQVHDLPRECCPLDQFQLHQTISLYPGVDVDRQMSYLQHRRPRPKSPGRVCETETEHRILAVVLF